MYGLSIRPWRDAEAEWLKADVALTLLYDCRGMKDSGNACVSYYWAEDYGSLQGGIFRSIRYIVAASRMPTLRTRRKREGSLVPWHHHSLAH